MGVTESALSVAKEFGKKVYSFNLYAERRDGNDASAPHLHPFSWWSLLTSLSADYPWLQHILGPSEETLPALAYQMQHYYKRPRLWFYSAPSSYYSPGGQEDEAEEYL